LLVHGPRSSGVLCPIFALPQGEGIGDLGPTAFRFIDRLHEAGFRTWALLPYSPIDHPYCPYSSISSFGIEPLFISLELLVKADLLTFNQDHIHNGKTVVYDEVVAFKKPLLTEAAFRFLAQANHPWRHDYQQFITRHSWVADLALFVTLKNHFNGLPFWEWPQPYRDRTPETLQQFELQHQAAIAQQQVLQYFAHRQWRDVHRYAQSKGIATFGDLPLYVAADSLDVWCHANDFQLDANKRVIDVAGVPPDAFSDTGQKWGNPLYDWEAMQKNGFSFWKKRLAYQHEQFDLLRIDHFLGLHRYWAIPAGNETATEGAYRPGPGMAFFESMQNHFGTLPWVLEDLGAVTPESESLKAMIGLPGMSVLQFGWDNPDTNPHHPNNHLKNGVCYLGTHDNETWNQWWAQQSSDVHAQVRDHLDPTTNHLREIGLHLGLSSSCQLSIIPLADLCGLGEAGRINVPGVAEGNWKWRCTAAALDQLDASHLAQLNLFYQRTPPKTTRSIMNLGFPVAPPLSNVSRTEWVQANELAHNYAWTWDKSTEALFEKMSPEHWRRERNPIKMLKERQPEQIAAFRSQISHCHEKLQATLNGVHFNVIQKDSVAYFCAEFGLVESFPIYSGGLGILAGDTLKEASDQNHNTVGIGLLYQRGYFRQQLLLDGTQIALSDQERPTDVGLQNFIDPKTKKSLRLSIPYADSHIHFTAWLAMVGRTPLFLLDSNVPENPPHLRAITDHLYVPDREVRLAQEILLGIGGVMLLTHLQINVSTYHLNEGHSAFLILERLQKALAQGMNMAEARAHITKNTVFTIHTPVPAGNEKFHAPQMHHALSSYFQQCALPEEEILKLGIGVEGNPELFDLTAFAIRHSAAVNGVSLLHGKTATETWQEVYGQEIPGITNGVHEGTWTGSAFMNLLEQKGPISPQTLWQAHQEQKAETLQEIEARLYEHYCRERAPMERLTTVRKAHLQDALVIGFARRFATYKRATLIFKDLQRLEKLLKNPDRPVALVFAGKAHPADIPGQELIRTISSLAHDPHWNDHILFIEDYNVRLGQRLVQGVDLWLNTPQRPLEASGTSGMKAAINGIPNCSILDGWWDEGFNDENGWAIKHATPHNDDHDHEDLLSQLENDIVPTFFDRNAEGLPLAYLKKMNHAFESGRAHFLSSRMHQEYQALYRAHR